MKLSGLFSLVLSVALSSAEDNSNVNNNNSPCCLCDECADVATTKVNALVLDEASVLSCSELALNVAEAERDVCDAVVQSHRSACCHAETPVAVIELHHADEMDTLQVIFPDDVSALQEGQEEEEATISDNEGGILSRITRALNWQGFSGSGSWRSTGAWGGYTWGRSSASAASVTAPSNSCQICSGGAYPTNPTGGVVIDSTTYKYGTDGRGTCAGLYSDIKKLSSNHQMCNPTKNFYRYECCQKPPSRGAANHGGGTWNW